MVANLYRNIWTDVFSKHVHNVSRVKDDRPTFSFHRLSEI